MTDNLLNKLDCKKRYCMNHSLNGLNHKNQSKKY